MKGRRTLYSFKAKLPHDIQFSRVSDEGARMKYHAFVFKNKFSK